MQACILIIAAMFIINISSLANASDLDKIPSSQFNGAIESLKIIETRHSGKLEAIVVIPRDMTRKQLRPTILKTLKKLKGRYNTASIKTTR